jgi:XTP/dITP diphosphohydrolase/tetrapyrrole methylase family protein/MazG family protein/ATP diphosphatase
VAGDNTDANVEALRRLDALTRRLRRECPWDREQDERTIVPHTVEAATAGQVLRNWDAIKATEPGREPGIFGEVPENLPGPLYARKVQRRAATSGFDFEHVPYEAVEGELEELREASDRDAAFHEVGDVLFAAVNVARKLKVDPELALRAAADRFRGRVQGAADLAAADGSAWQDLGPEQQLGYYARARLNEEQP